MKTILALIGLAAAIGFAQEPGMHKKQMKMMNMPHYDAANVTTISGSVTEVKQHMGMGIHLIVNTADQVYEVHVGPMAYLTKNKISFSKGDAVTVTGSKMK